MPIRLGVDLVGTDEVRESLAAHGDRYLERIYTEAEQRDCAGSPRRLATRFAVKEATMKALGRVDESLPWRSIEMIEDAGGRPSVQLSGVAAELATSRGVRHLEVSLTNTRSAAAALVLAELEDVR